MAASDWTSYAFFFAGLHFDISCFFLSAHAFSDDLPLLHNEGIEARLKRFEEGAAWVEDVVMPDWPTPCWHLWLASWKQLWRLLLHHCSLITTSFQNACQSFVSLSPHNFAIVCSFARPQVGSYCISASLSNFLFKQRNHSSQGKLIEELHRDEEGSKCLHFVKA